MRVAGWKEKWIEEIGDERTAIQDNSLSVWKFKVNKKERWKKKKMKERKIKKNKESNENDVWETEEIKQREKEGKAWKSA